MTVTPPQPVCRLLVATFWLACAHAAGAQQAARPPAPPASAASAAAASQRIEITGGRESDTDERRRSTAAKIVIGREEIDKFGDATLGEVLRRLPGVTTPGAPGRGGPPRMRGLGNGYTQLLIDGQRIPPGFSLESLTPEQVERIEILRAPTAETGARAVAGTINIVTREGFKRRVNDLRVGLGVENGHASPGLFWTHNDSAGDFIYNLSAAAFAPHRESRTQTRTTVTDVATGTPLEDRTATTATTESRTAGNFTSRLQWRLGGEGSGDQLMLQPSVFTSSGSSRSVFAVDQPLARPCAAGQVLGCTPRVADFGDTGGENRFTNARLGAQWRSRIGTARVEANATGAWYRSSADSLRTEFDTGAAQPLRVLEDHTRSQEKSLMASAKSSMLVGGDPAAGGEHSVVAGAEFDHSRRNDERTSLQNGAPLLADFGDNLQASALRLAAYAQDEWAIDPHWAAHAGLRWEGITTRGDAGDGSRPSNRSSVWTPLLHAVWKPDPKGRDQVRTSLTRSYRSPPLGNLIARPTINRDYDPAAGSNTVTSPDSAGNPALKPELATGIDVAIERYLEGGGVLSASVFHREIKNLMRGVTTLETVSWSSSPRWVRRTQNIGDATTSGVELEAKFRLDQWVAGATPVEMRANLAFYDSKVKSVPGPDNRLDQQARATGNLGGDYRLRSLPLTLGGNVNWVPGYTTRLDVDQTVAVSTKVVWDAYALWTFSPTVALRLLGNNLAPRDYASTTVDDAAVSATSSERTTVRSVGPSYVNWQLRLELKL